MASHAAIDNFNRANALVRAGELDAAIAAYDEAITAEPNLAQAHLNRAQAMRRLGRMDEAAVGLEAAAALDPGNVATLSILSGFLVEQRRPEAAVAAFDRLAALRAQSAVVQANRATALRMARRIDEAIAGYEAALRLDPAVEIRPLLAACELTLGRFESGWLHYEQRRESGSRYGRGGFSTPGWLGETPVAGKTVLVHAEQGLGDTIMFSRFLALLKDAEARVLFAPQKALAPLMASLDVELVDVEDPALAFDLHARLMSLPMAFGVTVDTIPSHTPYLNAEPDRVSRWKARLGGAGFKIGVSWRGSVEGLEAGRAFDPAQLRVLSEAPGVRLISLQRDSACPPDLQRALGVEVLDGLDDDGAFLDTAAVIEACDLTVACDSSVANLAGALGRPTWIALSRHSDWRWLADRPDTPWYPTARLFRQETLDDWAGVFRQMATALRPLASAHRNQT